MQEGYSTSRCCFCDPGRTEGGRVKGKRPGHLSCSFYQENNSLPGSSTRKSGYQVIMYHNQLHNPSVLLFSSTGCSISSHSLQILLILSSGPSLFPCFPRSHGSILFEYLNLELAESLDFSRVASHAGEELKLRKPLTQDPIVMVVAGVTHKGDVSLSDSVGISHHLTLLNTHSL